MGINLTDAAYNFNTVTQSFDNEKHSRPHFYLAISRDENKSIIGCRHTQERSERASLLEINEFANICFQQYNSEDNPEFINDINVIKIGLEEIQAQVNNSKEQNCINGLWFWLQLGSSILAATRDIIAKMSLITESLFPMGIQEINQSEFLADQALAKAKEHEQLGHNNPALGYYKISSKNGNLEASNILAECYTTTRLGQKSNPQDASKYHLKAAGKYLELNLQEAFSHACHKAFTLAPEKTVLYIIKHWHMDVTTLFSMNQILYAQCDPKKIAEAYSLNARSYVKEKNSEKAIEQCKNILKFDPLQFSQILFEIINSDVSKK